MKKRQTLWAIVLGSMLAITGCGDDGTDGSGGSGGSGGPPSSTCEAICSSTCVLLDIDPDLGVDECLSTCAASVFDDNCSPQADAFLGCMESNNCDPEATACQNEAIDLGRCLSGINFP